MAHREYGCAVLVDTQGRLLLQRRDDIPGILYPGLIGLFGGHREEGETLLACAVREITEEIGLPVAAERFELLLRFRGADMDIPGGTATGDCFLVTGLDVARITVTEGSLHIATVEDIPRVAHEMVASALLAVRTYIDRLRPPS